MKQLVTQFHPAHRTMFGRPLDYYWSAEETEWATDVMFHSREALANIYPNLLHHGITTFGSSDVLRFLGQLPIIRRDSTREILSSVNRPNSKDVACARSSHSATRTDRFWPP